MKEKIHIYVNSTNQSCPKKRNKTFLIENFFHLPPVSTTPVVHLELRISPRIFEKIRNGLNGILRNLGETDTWKKPVSITPAVTVAKFAAGDIDTGSKFATGVVDTGGAPLLANISANFRKKFDKTLMLFSGAWGNMIHEKGLKQKIS
jgi:hypothetical protein